MQEHVELEVSLEIIMSKIAKSIFKLCIDENKENVEDLEKLVNIQEEAYKGDRNIIENILN